MRVVAFVGLPASGKSEAAAVAREMDIPVVTMGDVVRQACRDRGLDPATDHGEVAQSLRAEDGPAAVAERSLPLIDEALSENDTVLIDGIRSDTELDRFQEAYGEDLELIRVQAPDDERASRLALRGRDATLSEGGESLADRDRRELAFGMGNAMERADMTITNDGTLGAFREAVRALLEEDG